MHTTLGTPGASSDLPFHPTLRHPLTDEPLQAVGIGRRGPIWPILGGAPDEGGGSDSGGDGADTSGGSDSGQQQDKPNDGTGGTDSGQGANGTQNDDDTGKSGDDKKPEPKDVKDFPAAAQRMIRELRKENGDNRTKVTAVESAMQKLKDDFAVALGLKKGEDVDPAKLQQQLTADVEKANERASTAELTLAVYLAADKHKADGAALIDTTSFMNEVRKLDAADKDFASDLAELIKQRVKDNPTRYGREPVKSATKSGAEHMNGGKPSERTGSLHAAVAKTMNRT